MYSIIIDKYKNLMIKDKQDAVEIYEYKDSYNIVGNIYLGKVINKINGMRCSYVDIGGGQQVFIQDENDLFSVNNMVIVQVKKNGTKFKKPIATTKIKITGEYVVLLPTEKHVTVSKKIVSEEERARLKKLVENLNLQCGIIFRTNAQDENKKILEDIDELIELWKNIDNKRGLNPQLIYESEEPIKAIIKNITDKNIEKIITDKENENYLNDILKCLDFDITLMVKDVGNDIIKELQKINKKMIWLKSGGSIVIEQTEALVSIDVNTGSFTGKRSLEETVKSINIEATIEIAKQIRLRNLRGIIIVDYINMKDSDAKDDIVKLMRKEVQKDRTNIEVLGFTKLNLLEITRKEIN